MLCRYSINVAFIISTNSNILETIKKCGFEEDRATGILTCKKIRKKFVSIYAFSPNAYYLDKYALIISTNTE